MKFRKDAVTRVALAAVGVAGLWVARSQQPPRQPLTMEKISANLWMIVGTGGNVAVMPTSQGVIVVDDYHHPHWSDVTVGVDRFLSETREFDVLGDLNRHGALGRKLYLIKR